MRKPYTAQPCEYKTFFGAACHGDCIECYGGVVEAFIRLFKERGLFILDENLMRWVNKEIEKKRFVDRTNAVEHALKQLIEGEKSITIKIQGKGGKSKGKHDKLHKKESIKQV